MIFSFDGKEFEISMFDAQAAMEQAETQCGMTSTSPTIELLELVATWAKARFGVKLSLTAAWQVWWAICELILKTRIAHQRIADIGAWLHIDATELSDDQLFGLTANLARVKAQSKLHTGQFDPLDFNQVFELTLLATGNEKEAKEARYKSLERYVDSRCGGS